MPSFVETKPTGKLPSGVGTVSVPALAYPSCEDRALEKPEGGVDGFVGSPDNDLSRLGR